MNRKYAFCRLTEEKKSLYNGLLSIKDTKNMTSEEATLDAKIKRSKSTFRCPRIGSFTFDDGCQIYMDLTRGEKYDIDVCVVGSGGEDGSYAVYEYEERSIQKVWEITPFGCDITYTCVFLEKNTKQARQIWFNTMSEAEYNVVDKILTESHLIDVFEVRQDEYGDYIWDSENNTKYSLKFGLYEIYEAMADPRECYELTDEEVEVFNDLLLRIGLKLKIE